MQRKTASKIRLLAEAAAADAGFEIVDLEVSGNRTRSVVRVFIDKPGGVNLADCERLSRRLGDLLDAHGAIETKYVLEVSSPGLDRPLRKSEDFTRFEGRRVRLRLRRPVDGRRKGVGCLNGISGGVISLGLDDGTGWSVPLEEVEKANLEMDWNAVFREKKSGRGSGSVSAEEGGIGR